MTRDPESWVSSAPGPFMRIVAGGPLQGVVPLTAIPERRGPTVVEASWSDGYEHSETVEAYSFELARLLAHSIADQLAAGIPPDLTSD